MRLYLSFYIAIATIAGCSSSQDTPPMSETGTPIDALSLYAPLLDNVPPSDCVNNCIWPLRGTEWRLEKLIDSTGSEATVAPETIHTLLFSEVDSRVVGRFDCEVLAGTFDFVEDAEASEMNKRGSLAFETISYTAAGCEVPVNRSTTLINQNEIVRSFLDSDALMLRDSGNILYLENSAGATLMYRARPDALDGVIRPFRIIANGDLLGNAYDDITATSTMIIYNSFEDFQSTTPNLAIEHGSDVVNLDFSRETLIGLFVAPIEYLGPTIRAEFILERDDETQVQFHAGLFWCDNGLGQPRGNNAPFELIAIASTVQPVLPYGTASSACP